MEISDIKDMLNSNWDSLVIELLPNAKRKGDIYTVGGIHGDPGDSMVLWRGARAGSWKDYAAGDDMRGDALTLIERVAIGADYSSKETITAAIKWAKNWLGLDDSLSELEMKARRARARSDRAARDKKAEQEREGRKTKAQAIWLKGMRPIKGTAAAYYLKARSVDLSLLGKSPGALVYEAECWESETRGPMPAMLACVTGEHGFMAVHRTYLAHTPDGWDQAPLNKPKTVFGDYAGGAIPLWRGASGKPLKAAPEGETVVLTEGIEDALSLAIAAPTMRIMAAVSLGNLGNVWLPPSVKTVVLAQDNDWDNPSAQDAFKQAVSLHKQKGRTVRIFKTPAHVGKDANDWLRAIMEGNL